MLTADQQAKLDTLKSQYEEVNNLPNITDPYILIVERALYDKNLAKMTRHIEGTEARAEAAVHLERIYTRAVGLFSKYGVKCYVDPYRVRIAIRKPWGPIQYVVEAKYISGHAPFTGLEYRVGIRETRVSKGDINHEHIMEQVALWVADNIETTV